LSFQVAEGRRGRGGITCGLPETSEGKIKDTGSAVAEEEHAVPREGSGCPYLIPSDGRNGGARCGLECGRGK